MDGPFGAAQPGCRLRLWWAGEGRYFAGTVGEATVQRGRRVLVFYDDGDSKAHDLRFEDWEPLAEHPLRRPHEQWPRSEEEAIERAWKGFPLTSERGSLQIYARAAMAGVGVRVPAIEVDGKASPLVWFEGDLFSARAPASTPLHELMRSPCRLSCRLSTRTGGANAAGLAVEAMKARDEQAPEPIKVNEKLFLAPSRCAAQLVECSSDVGSANCDLRFLPRGRERLWPALVPRRRIAPGEAVTFWYSAEPANVLYVTARHWAERAACMQATLVRTERACKRKKAEDGRDGNGRYEKVGSAPARPQARDPKNGRFGCG